MTLEEPERGGLQRVHSLDLDDVFNPQYVKDLGQRKAYPNLEGSTEMSCASTANYDAEGEGDTRARQGGGMGSALGRSMSGIRTGGRIKTRMRVSQTPSSLQNSINLTKFSLSYMLDDDGDDVQKDSKSDVPDLLGSTSHTISTVQTTQTAKLRSGRTRMQIERMKHASTRTFDSAKLLDKPTKSKPKDARKKIERSKSGGDGAAISNGKHSKTFQNEVPRSPRRPATRDTKNARHTPKGKAKPSVSGDLSPKSSNNGRRESRYHRNRSKSPTKRRSKSPVPRQRHVPSPPLIGGAAEARVKSPRKSPSPVTGVIPLGPEDDLVKSNENIPPKRPPSRKASPKVPPSRQHSDEKRKASKSTEVKNETPPNLQESAPLSPTQLRKPSIHVPDEETQTQKGLAKNQGIPVEIRQQDDAPQSPPSMLMPAKEQDDISEIGFNSPGASSKPSTFVSIDAPSRTSEPREEEEEKKTEEPKRSLNLPGLKREPESAFVEVASKDSKHSRPFEQDSDSDEEDGGTVLQFDPTQSDHVIRVNQVAKSTAEYDIDNMDGSVSHGEIKEINDPISDALSLQGPQNEKTQIFDFLESDPDIGEDQLDELKSLDGPSGGEEEPEDIVRRRGSKKKTPFGLDYPSGGEAEFLPRSPRSPPSPRSPRSPRRPRKPKPGAKNGTRPRKPVSKTKSFTDDADAISWDGNVPKANTNDLNKYASEDDAMLKKGNKRKGMKKRLSNRSKASGATTATGFRVNSLDFPGIEPSENGAEEVDDNLAFGAASMTVTDSKPVADPRRAKKKKKKVFKKKPAGDANFDPLRGPSGHEPTGYGRAHPDNYAGSCDEVEVRPRRPGRKRGPSITHCMPEHLQSSPIREPPSPKKSISPERNLFDMPPATAFEMPSSTAYESEVDPSPPKTGTPLASFAKSFSRYFAPGAQRRRSPSGGTDRDDGGSVSGTSVGNRRFFGGGGRKKAAQGHALLLDNDSSDSSDGGFP